MILPTCWSIVGWYPFAIVNSQSSKQVSVGIIVHPPLPALLSNWHLAVQFIPYLRVKPTSWCRNKSIPLLPSTKYHCCKLYAYLCMLPTYTSTINTAAANTNKLFLYCSHYIFNIILRKFSLSNLHCRFMKQSICNFV